MRNIRILRMIARLNIGGPAMQACILTHELNKDGFESVLVTGAVEEGEKQTDNLITKYKIKPIIIPELGREIKPLADLYTLYKVSKLIRQYKPHIVHTHTSKAGFIGRVSAFLNKVPVKIHTFHGHTFYGYFNPAKNRLFLAIEKMLSKITDSIITISPLQKMDVTKKYKVAPEKKCVVIPLGLELDEFLKLAPKPGDKTKLGFNKADIVIGTVGRLAKIKNHRFLIEVADLFYKETKDESVKFVIIGDGKLKKDIIDYRNRLSLADKVHILGWQNELVKVYSCFDIFALPSKNEGTPVAAIEAMASARPVISTAVGGVPDMVKDGETGFLVKEGDTKEFVDRLKKLIYNRETRISMGIKARNAVKDTFHKDRLIKEIKSLYVELLKEKGVL